MKGEKLLTHVEGVIATLHIAPSRFGRDAVNDPRLVFDLRRGRQLKHHNARRVRAFLSRLTGEECNA